MQTSKFIFAVSAVAVLVLPYQTQAGPDNPEQAKMRAALRRMMEQSATTSTPPPAPAKTEAKPAPPPAPAVAAQPAPQSYDSVPPPSDPAKAAREREVMRQTLATSQNPPPPAPAAPTAPVAPAPVAATPVAPVAPPPVAPPTAVPPPAPTTPTTYTQLESPASPLPVTKQSRLADLLAKYRADTITAQEYHTKRAAILAEQ